jgi:hypothetical protein
MQFIKIFNKKTAILKEINFNIYNGVMSQSKAVLNKYMRFLLSIIGIISLIVFTTFFNIYYAPENQIMSQNEIIIIFSLFILYVSFFVFRTIKNEYERVLSKNALPEDIFEEINNIYNAEYQKEVLDNTFETKNVVIKKCKRL